MPARSFSVVVSERLHHLEDPLVGNGVGTPRRALVETKKIDD
jgi:hypothetical protein